MKQILSFVLFPPLGLYYMYKEFQGAAWFMWFMLFVFCPVGLYLLAGRPEYSTKAKVYIGMASALWFCVVLPACV